MANPQITAPEILRLLAEGKITEEKAREGLLRLRRSNPGEASKGLVALAQQKDDQHLGDQENNLRGRVLQMMGKEGKTDAYPGMITRGPVQDFVDRGVERLTRVPGNLGAGPEPSPNMGGSFQRGVGPAINNTIAGAWQAVAPAAAITGVGALAAAPVATGIGMASGLLGQQAGESATKNVGPKLGFNPNQEDIEAGGGVGAIAGGATPSVLKALISRTPKLSAAMQAAKTWQEKNKVFEQAQAYVQELFGKQDVADKVYKLRATETSIAPQKAEVEYALLESQNAAKRDAISAARATLQTQKERGAREVKRLAENAKRLKNQPGYEAAVRQAEVAQKTFDANIKFAELKEAHALADAELSNFNKDLTKEQISALQRQSVGLKNEAASLQSSGRTAPKVNPEAKKLVAQISETQKTIDEMHKSLGTTDPEVIKNSVIDKIYATKVQELEGLRAKLGAIASPGEGPMATAGQRKAKVTDLKNAARVKDQLTRDVRAGVEEVSGNTEQEKTWQNLSKAKIRAEQEMENARINLQALGEHKNQIKLDLSKNRVAGVNPAEADVVDGIFGKISEAQDAYIQATTDKLNHSLAVGAAKNNLTQAPLAAAAAETEAKLASQRLAIEHAQARATADSLNPGEAPQVQNLFQRLKGAAGTPANKLQDLTIPKQESPFTRMLKERLQGTGVNTSALGALLPGYLDGEATQPQEEVQ